MLTINTSTGPWESGKLANDKPVMTQNQPDKSSAGNLPESSVPQNADQASSKPVAPVVNVLKASLKKVANAGIEIEPAASRKKQTALASVEVTVDQNKKASATMDSAKNTQTLRYEPQIGVNVFSVTNGETGEIMHQMPSESKLRLMDSLKKQSNSKSTLPNVSEIA